jgi:hypothetical protein
MRRRMNALLSESPDGKNRHMVLLQVLGFPDTDPMASVPGAQAAVKQDANRTRGRRRRFMGRGPGVAGREPLSGLRGPRCGGSAQRVRNSVTQVR